MNIIEFDGAEFVSNNETHQILKEKLELPDYYGCNLDALWDCLTGWIDTPIKIIWNNYGESYSILGDFAVKLKETFEHAQENINGIQFEVYK